MHHGSQPTRYRWRAAAAVLATLTLAIGACGDDDDDASTDTTEQSEGGGADATLDVADFSFVDVTAPAGGTLEVVNSSGGSHTVTADDGAFDEALGDDDTIELTVPAEPGEYPFHCEIHPDMTATLTAE